MERDHRASIDMDHDGRVPVGLMTPPLTRRTLLASTLAAAAPLPAVDRKADEPLEAELHWLEGLPRETIGSAWGVPWPRGRLTRDTKLALTTADGTAVPVQSWPLAYWPDGSLKWTGHAIAPGAEAAGYRLTPGNPARPETPIAVRRDGSDLILANGVLEVRLATRGDLPIREIRRAGRTTATAGRLVLDLQDRPDDDTGTPVRTAYRAAIEKATVEQSGPVRAVVRLTGAYRRGHRRILPWTLRVYLSAGSEAIRFVHSFTWDADPARDFVRGLGLRFDVPMTDATHDRHVRFGVTGGGVWGEPVRVLTGL